MKVLLSIKPEFAFRILDGSKRFEFRKALYGNTRISTVVIYVTRPVGMLVGEFDVRRIVSGTPAAVWSQTSEYAGITREFFESYFDGRREAFALEVSELRRYDPPINPHERMDDFVPPQGYMYVDDDLTRSWAEDRQYDMFGGA